MMDCWSGGGWSGGGAAKGLLSSRGGGGDSIGKLLDSIDVGAEERGTVERSPSPRPSPPRRGRIVSSSSAIGAVLDWWIGGLMDAPSSDFGATSWWSGGAELRM